VDTVELMIKTTSIADKLAFKASPKRSFGSVTVVANEVALITGELGISSVIRRVARLAEVTGAEVGGKDI
jgi:hypothetical protein